MTQEMHPEANSILAHLSREGMTALYHFTSVENLPSICRAQALCSKQTLAVRGIRGFIAGGNALSHDLDKRIGNWDKVSLSFTPHIPMIYSKKQKQHLCFFVIRPEIAMLRGVVFTDTNAAKLAEQKRGEGLIGLNNIRFDIIRAIPRPWERDGWKKYVQAEILVPDQIPFQYISKVVFVSKASLQYAERLCSHLSHPPFVVDAHAFANFWMSKWTVDFPHVVELTLTDSKIDENVVQLPYIHKNKYSKSTCSHITAIASVQTVTGLNAEVRWLPINIIESTNFETSDRYFHWSHIELNQLSSGVYTVEYILNDQHWAATDFEISE